MSDDAPPFKAKKKLPFKPTALRRKVVPALDSPAGSKDNENGDVDDGLSLFRRAKEMQPRLDAENERRRIKRQKREEEQRQSAEAAAKRLLETDALPDEVAQPSLPARVVTPTAEASDTKTELVTPPASKRTRLDARRSPSARVRNGSTWPPPRTNPSTLSPLVIDLDDSEDHATLSDSSVKETVGSKPNNDDDNDNDDDSDSAWKPANHASSDDDLIDSAAAADEDDEFAEWERQAEERQAEEIRARGSADKAVIEILVSTSMPNYKPCRIKCHFDKPLRAVRSAWVTVQKSWGHVAKEIGEDDFVLTWRKQKVYPTTSLLNLGIKPRGDGRAEANGGSDGIIAKGTRVLLEAWTLDAFREQEQRRQEQADKAHVVDDDAPETSDKGAEPEPEVKFRIILKARGFEDVKLTVRPETTVETLVTGFKAQRNVASSKHVSLWFDGACLEEHITMDAAEIEDMDSFEVLIR